jgi:hypothetical protein
MSRLVCALLRAYDERPIRSPTAHPIAHSPLSGALCSEPSSTAVGSLSPARPRRRSPSPSDLAIRAPAFKSCAVCEDLARVDLQNALEMPWPVAGSDCSSLSRLPSRRAAACGLSAFSTPAAPRSRHPVGIVRGFDSRRLHHRPKSAAADAAAF